MGRQPNQLSRQLWHTNSQPTQHQATLQQHNIDTSHQIHLHQHQRFLPMHTHGAIQILQNEIGTFPQQHHQRIQPTQQR